MDMLSWEVGENGGKGFKGDGRRGLELGCLTETEEEG
jgi:hypothetical protein